LGYDGEVFYGDSLRVEFPYLRSGAFSLPGYPTVKVVTDFALTETPDATHGPLIGSSVALGLVFGEGPTMAAQYRDEAKGFDGYIIRKWQEPKVVIQDAITKICT
jgi:hypothetical protein